ncbi:hypothetical protein [Sigmofec virus UA08Rod_7365]|uniref:Uncharacterized protein n=1 Tax=Sigmofec virus UA08Rod_7365 TaxID=2929245 RepID=A0A976N0Y4_9VIRU|nr:hypothetical protein [Sigmofec virus UA08Rod_7365]
MTKMEKIAVHHLHVKYRGEIFTIFCCSDVISMSDLYCLIQEIKDISHGKK